MLITVPAAIVVLYVLAKVGRSRPGLRESTGRGHDTLNAFDGAAAAGFGISLSLGLLGSTMADQTFWQKAWALKPAEPRTKIRLGRRCWFYPIPIVLGLLGLVGLGVGVTADDLGGAGPGGVGPYVVATSVCPVVLIALYVLIILNACYSSIDGAFSALSSVVAVDILKRAKPDISPKSLFRWTKSSIIIVGVVGGVVVNSGIDYVELVNTVYFLKAALIIPLALAIFWRRMSSTAFVSSLVLAIAIGYPIRQFVSELHGDRCPRGRVARIGGRHQPVVQHEFRLHHPAPPRRALVDETGGAAVDLAGAVVPAETVDPGSGPMIAFWIAVAVGAVVALTYVALGVQAFIRVRRDVLAAAATGRQDDTLIDVRDDNQHGDFTWKAIGAVIFSGLVIVLLGVNGLFWYLPAILAVGSSTAVIAAFIIERRRERYVTKRKAHLLGFVQHGVMNHASTMWAHPRDKVGYHWSRPEYWRDLGRIMERGLFDAMFIADELAPYTTYKGNSDPVVKYAGQCPVHDPPLWCRSSGRTPSTSGSASLVDILCAAVHDGPPPVLAGPPHQRSCRVEHRHVVLEERVPGDGQGQPDAPRQTLRGGRGVHAAVYQLWDTWDDDAIVYDRETGSSPTLESPRDRLPGAVLQVQGPALRGAVAAERPVLWQAGSSDQGREFASKHAESVFGIFPTPKSMRAYADDIRGRAANHGRDPESVKLIYGLQTIIDRDIAGQRQVAEFVDRVQIGSALGILSGHTGVDFSTLGLDDNVVDADVQGIRGLFDAILEAKDGAPVTVREAAQIYGISMGAPWRWAPPPMSPNKWSSTSTKAAATVSCCWPPISPGCFNDMTELLVPELQRRGRFRTRYPGTTPAGKPAGVLISGRPRKAQFLAFMQHGVSSHSVGMWRHPLDKVGWNYAAPPYWQHLARTLERGLFDAVFLADELAPYNSFEDSSDATSDMPYRHRHTSPPR